MGEGDSLSVLLLVGDALRRDALAVQGPDGQPTALTRRLRDWVRLDRVYAGAPWTLPASTSLLTGTDAFAHQHFSHKHTLTVDSLVPRFDVAHRAAVINNSVLTRGSGLAGGFDPYRWIADVSEAFGAARTFLRDRKADGASYLLMLHSNLPHDYYLPASRCEYEQYFPGRDDYAPIGYRVLAWKGVVDQQPLLRRIYDACALRLHDELDTVLDATPLDRTIVVLLADHGEGFEPQRARIHHGGRMHDDLVRVPCAIWLPPALPRERRDQFFAAANAAGSAVGVIDVLPTLLGLLGQGDRVPEGLNGRNLVALAPPDARRVLRIEDRRYLYLASRLRLNTNARGKNMSRAAKVRNRLWRATVARSHVLQGFVDGPRKLIVTEFVAPSAFAARAGSSWLARQHNGDPLVVVRGRSWLGLELFDVDTDPGETTNLLLGADGARTQRALATVDAYRAGDFTPRLADLL